METVILLLTKYGYLLLFPIAVVEGPIVTVIAGFLSTLGIFNIFIAFIVVVAGDVAGDSGFYWIGRSSGGGIFSRYFKKHKEKINRVKDYFRLHRNKAIAVSKLFHGIGITGLLAAGNLRVPYKRYITICFLTTAVQSIVLITVGALFGRAYHQINRYLNYYAAMAIIIGLAGIFFITVRKLKLFSD